MSTRTIPPSFLHVEDDDGHAEIFARMLTKEWPGCRIVRVWTRQEFEASLELESYDVILCDHTLGAFDGLAALEIARASCPGTPFIFLSGTLGEDRAIEALKRGAADYVMKGSPARFISAIRAALAAEIGEFVSDDPPGPRRPARAGGSLNLRPISIAKANPLLTPRLPCRFQDLPQRSEQALHS